MRTWAQLLMASAVLLTQGFGQEPKQALNQGTLEHATKQTVASGSPLPAAPVMPPKALPPLNPPLAT